MSKKRILIGAIGAIFAAIMIGVAFFGVKATVNSPARLLSLGEKYLLELDYEQAVVYFERVIEIEPMNARAYLGAAEAYIALGQTDKAIEILRRGLDATNDAAILAKLNELDPPITLEGEYYKTLKGAVDTFGLYNGAQWGQGEGGTTAGVVYAALIDFDGDNTSELFYVFGDGSKYAPDYAVYGFDKERGASKLAEGSIDSSSGDPGCNVEITRDSAGKAHVLTHNDGGSFQRGSQYSALTNGAWTSEAFLHKDYEDDVPDGKGYFIEGAEVTQEVYNSRTAAYGDILLNIYPRTFSADVVDAVLDALSRGNSALMELTRSAKGYAETIYESYLRGYWWKADESVYGNAGAKYNPFDYMSLTEYKIFDIDGDGMSELWFNAAERQDYNPNYTYSRYSAFCDIVDGKVRTLTSAKSLGVRDWEDYVTIKFDTQTKALVVAGVTLDYGERTRIFEYRSGALSSAVMDFALDDGLGNPIYTVNGERVDKERYLSVAARYVDVDMNTLEPFPAWKKIYENEIHNSYGEVSVILRDIDGNGTPEMFLCQNPLSTYRYYELYTVADNKLVFLRDGNLDSFYKDSEGGVLSMFTTRNGTVHERFQVNGTTVTDGIGLYYVNNTNYYPDDTDLLDANGEYCSVNGNKVTKAEYDSYYDKYFAGKLGEPLESIDIPAAEVRTWTFDD